jgi:hypothetical protein
MTKWFFINFFILLSGCSNKDTQAKGIISKKDMTSVLWDMTRAGEFLNGFVLYKDSSVNKTAVSNEWYEKIFRLHKTSLEEFNKSYAYYDSHPVLLKEILDSLSRKQVPASTYGQASPKTNADSTRKNTVIPSIDTRVRTIDSISRRRILRKSLKP